MRIAGHTPVASPVASPDCWPRKPEFGGGTGRS